VYMIAEAQNARKNSASALVSSESFVPPWRTKSLSLVTPYAVEMIRRTSGSNLESYASCPRVLLGSSRRIFRQDSTALIDSFMEFS
jgi:hypothetical protein